MSRNTFVRVAGAIAMLAAVSLTALPALAQEEVGYFRTRIDPHVAGVFINGTYYGTAAMFGHRAAAIKLAPGTYKVEIVDPRYQTIEANVEIKAGQTSTLRMAMKPTSRATEGPFGELITEGFGNAAVYLNGKYYANTAELSTPGQSLLLKPGEYTMKIVPVGGGPEKEEKIQINADETLVISKTGAPVRRR